MLIDRLNRWLAKGERFGRATSRARSAAAALASALLFLPALHAADASAQAVDVDWLVNLDDTGFDPMNAGGTVVYQLSVSNAGTTAAPATTVTFAVPATTELLSVAGTGITGCTPVPATGPATVTCNVPALNPQSVANANFSVKSPQTGNISVTASVPITVGTTTDSDTTNNSVTQQTTITAGADLSVAVNGPATAQSGSTVSYVYTITNNGPDTATSSTFTMPVPAGLTGVTAAGCSVSGSNLVCTIASLNSGSSTTRSLTGKISAASGSVNSSGTVSGGTPADPISGNNSANRTTTVTAGSDVEIVKSRSPSAVYVGDTVTFTLAATSTGGNPSGLQIVDTLPSNYTILSASGTAGWTCGTSGQTVTCDRATGAGAGANVSHGSVTITATAATEGPATNEATISSTGPGDPDSANNTRNDGGTTINNPTSDLRANKSGPDPALAVVGPSYSYSYAISTTNLGNKPFTGQIVMTDSLPAGITLTGASGSGWACTPTSATGPASIVCTRSYTSGSPLAVNGTTPAVTLTGSFTQAALITNSMTVTTVNPEFDDPVLSNNSASFQIESQDYDDSADVSVVKTVLSPNVISGDIQEFTLEVINAGPSTATNVVLTDALTGLITNGSGSTGQGYVGETTSAGNSSGPTCSSAANGTGRRDLTCNISNLPVCTAGVNCPKVTIQVRPGGNTSTRTNVARAVSTETADSVLSNNVSNTVSYNVSEARADVTVTKSATPATPVVGQNLEYTVTAINLSNGLSSASAVKITDTLPPNVVFVSAVPAAGTCSTKPLAGSTTGPGNDQVVCDLGDMNNGTQRAVTIIVRPRTATANTTLTNSATVSTDTVETNTSNNSVTHVSGNVGPPSLDLLVNKVDDIDPVVVGDNAVYTITVTNNGPSAAEDVVITDTLPASRLSFQSHTAPTGTGGSCSLVPAADSMGQTLTCGLPYLAPGATSTMTVTVKGVAKGVATNVANVRSAEYAFETNTGNNTEDEQTTVRTRADLEVVSKTASPATVNLHDPFTYTIIVRNNAGANFAEADNTVLTDNLPSGMRLTGAPTASVTSGTATSTSCTGSAGSTSFTCSFGTVSSGGEISISVPVKVISVTAQNQTVTNTASISTSSFDPTSANNSKSGDVSVNSSSIAGTVYRDFNDDGNITASADTGISGVTMTLSGTSFDGDAITRTATTDSNGNFTFPYLPAGTYSITRGAGSESHLVDSTNPSGGAKAGTGGGTVTSQSLISGVALPANTGVTGYLFPRIPTARIGIAKAVQSAPSLNADGSFTVTFRLHVKNHSLETLNSLTITDTLQGIAPAFGTHVTLATPATSPMTAGTYTLLSVPAGTCSGLNASFNGASNATVASGGTLAAGSTCQVDIALRVRPTSPPPAESAGARYLNQATVTGEGALSGQTSATNPQLSDLSHSGSNTDPNGNGISNESGENNQTPITYNYTTGIEVTKTADTSGFASPVVSGNTINYTISVKNTGTLQLTGISVTDTLKNGDNTTLTLVSGPTFNTGSDTASDLVLSPNETWTYSASYTLAQADINSGSLTNTAGAQGTSPYSETVNDTGDVVTNFTSAPSITLVKTANTAGVTAPAQVGQKITYNFTVKNTGNVTLTNVTVTDPKATVTGTPIASLAPGASNNTAFTAEYTITQADLNAGKVDNTATVTGKSPANQDVTDISGTAEDNNTPTSVPLSVTSAISVVKTGLFNDANSDGGATPGETITYTYTVKNTGTVTLTEVAVSESAGDFTGTGTLPVPAWQANSGASPQGTLQPGETATFRATYALTADDIGAGGVDNKAGTSGKPPTGANVNDESHPTSETENGPTTVPLVTPGAIKAVKTSAITNDMAPAGLSAGDTLTYTIVTRNVGGAELSSVRIQSDTLSRLTSPLTEITSFSAANFAPASVATLAPGAEATFTGFYTVTQTDIDAGGLSNTATAAGSSGTVAVTDVSDDGDDTDGNTENDPTVNPVIRMPGIALVKRGSAKGTSVSYTYVATNTGNVTLFNVAVTEESFSGTGAMPVPAYKSGGANLDNDPAGALNDLAPGGSVTWTASYTMTKEDVAAGEVLNRGLAEGKDFTNGDVSDLSGTDAGNDDPTRVGVKLIDIVRDELTDTLSDHLRGLITVESGRFNSFAKKGAGRLRSPEECAAAGDDGMDGGFFAEYTPEGLVMNADATVHKELHCAERTRYILDSQLDVRHMDGTTAATASATLLRETVIGEDALFGQFIGGYYDMPAGETDYDGTITGIGLHAGVYGAHRIEGELIADGYLAVSAGRQTFDLDLGSAIPIVAEGESRYAAGYAGIGVSGEFERLGLLIEPRASLDAAYALPWMEELELSSGQTVQQATLDLPELGLVRATYEARLRPAGEYEGSGFLWAATPKGFCQYDFGHDAEVYCGAGLGLELGYLNEEMDREIRFAITGEAAPDHFIGSGSLRYIWYVDEGRGASEFSLGLTGEGSAEVGYSFDWKL